MDPEILEFEYYMSIFKNQAPHPAVKDPLLHKCLMMWRSDETKYIYIYTHICVKFAVGNFEPHLS